MTTTKTDDLDHLAERLDHLASFDERIWDNAPQVTAARARAARMTAAGAQLQSAVHDSGNLTALVEGTLDRLLDGNPLDAEQLRSDIAATVAATQAQDAVQRAIAARSVTVHSDVATVEQAHADKALSTLHGTLLELADVGRQLLVESELSGSLAHAGRAGQARVLLEAAAGVHDRLRFTQQRLTTSPDFDGPSLVRRHGIVQHVEGYEPWRTWLSAGGDGYSDVTTLADLVDAGGLPLLELVCRDAAPWVPTLPELEQRQTAMRARVEQARYAKRNPNTSPQADASSGARVTVDGEQLRPSVPSRQGIR